MIRNRKIAIAVRSTAVSAGVVMVAVFGSAPAGADSSGGSPSGGSTSGGASGPMAPIGDAIEEFGQSLCPKLVKPGSDLAAAVSEMQGNSGLTPTLTGMVTGLAIQLECPAFMAAVADGKVPEVLKQAGSSGASPLLQLPGATASKPKDSAHH